MRRGREAIAVECKASERGFDAANLAAFRRRYPKGRTGSLCDWTGICPLWYIPGMESSFAVIAAPNRRVILSLLASSERSVGEIERRLRMPQTSVSKHLRVLREAGFVESRVEAQRRVYRIRPEPLMEVDAWLAPFRRLWTAHVDALERHLDRMAQAPRRGKTR